MKTDQIYQQKTNREERNLVPNQIISEVVVVPSASMTGHASYCRIQHDTVSHGEFLQFTHLLVLRELIEARRGALKKDTDDDRVRKRKSRCMTSVVNVTARRQEC